MSGINKLFKGSSTSDKKSDATTTATVVVGNLEEVPIEVDSSGEAIEAQDTTEVNPTKKNRRAKKREEHQKSIEVKNDNSQTVVNTANLEIKEEVVPVDSILDTAPTTIEEAYEKVYAMIPKEYDEYIKKVAQNAGVSEDLVKIFIINEGKVGTKEAALTAYKRSGDVLTIGFGHTNLCRKIDFKVKEGTTITLQKAFDLLEGDIMEMKKYARKSVGAENFDNAPKSLQALFIEYCFQRGPGGKLKSENMKANLSKKYYGAIAAGSLFDKGYNRRSAYRFILAIRDFPIAEKQNALKMLKDKGNYDNILKSLSGNEKTMFKEFCNRIENGV